MFLQGGKSKGIMANKNCLVSQMLCHTVFRHQNASQMWLHASRLVLLCQKFGNFRWEGWNGQCVLIISLCLTMQKRDKAHLAQMPKNNSWSPCGPISVSYYMCFLHTDPGKMPNQSIQCNLCLELRAKIRVASAKQWQRTSQQTTDSEQFHKKRGQMLS